MRVDLFDYDLPPDRIALRPAEPRESAKLLRVGANGALDDLTIAALPDLVRAGDAIVVNDTRVISARLNGVRIRGDAVAHIEAMLIKRVDANHWDALLRPAKKVKVGERIVFGATSQGQACLLNTLDAEVASKGENGEVRLAFAFSDIALEEAIERLGETPLPPYIAVRRRAGDSDRRDYQTVFAAEPGAVAAPTAGLHFTQALLSRLETAGAQLHRVTLHVGAGTFLPVKVEDTIDHRMHSEHGRLTAEVASALNSTRAKGGRIIAIGTTSLRLLESAIDEQGVFHAFRGETSIFLTPGHRFRSADVLLTNFHLARSTLLMLVSAFSGIDRIRRAYSHAIANHYRFYSYGDACWLERNLSES